MSNQEVFESHKPTIEAIEAKNVVVPSIPVDIYNQEAEDLHYWAMDDKDRLVARGLVPEILDDLLVRTQVCRHAQGLWFKERHARQEAELEWKEKSPQGYEMRDRLIEEFEFAFHQEPSLMSRIGEAKKGNSHADMIQDLTDLALLGNEYQELLTPTNFDIFLLEEAISLSDQLAGILARANGEKAEDSSAKLMRDRAYTHLKEVVDEVRRVGRFVFKREKDRLVGYHSNYRSNHRS